MNYFLVCFYFTFFISPFEIFDIYASLGFRFSVLSFCVVYYSVPSSQFSLNVGECAVLQVCL